MTTEQFMTTYNSLYCIKLCSHTLHCRSCWSPQQRCDQCQTAV